MINLILDNNGVEVKEGNFIRFTNTEKIYKVVSEYTELGFYEDYKFIGLKTVLKNFEIVH